MEIKMIGGNMKDLQSLLDKFGKDAKVADVLKALTTK